MEVQENGGLGLDHEDHPLLHKQVHHPKTGREGTVTAVVRQTLGYVKKGPREALTAYVRPTGGGMEFTVPPNSLELM